jgi:transposase
MNRLKITDAQRYHLRLQLVQAGDLRLYRRTLAVLEFDQGRSATDIALMLGVTRQSVYNWVLTYIRSGAPIALADEPREGRPPCWRSQEEAILRALLACSPQQLGYVQVSWTVPLLQEALQRRTGRCFADSTIRRALRRLDYVWKRPRYTLEPDPQREKKTADSAANSRAAAPQCRAR